MPERPPLAHIICLPRGGRVVPRSCSGLAPLRQSRGLACSPRTPAAPTRGAVFFIVSVRGPSPVFFWCLACGFAFFPPCGCPCRLALFRCAMCPRFVGRLGGASLLPYREGSGGGFLVVWGLLGSASVRR